MAVKTERFVDPFDAPRNRSDAWRMGMRVFVVVVVVLFVAAILGYLVVRLADRVGGEWRPANAPGLPPMLLLSTALAGAVSASLQVCVGAARRGRTRRCAHAAAAALASALLFLASQSAAWWTMLRQHLAIDSSLYAWTFYVLTALHALHVLGGLPSLALVAVRARRGRYGPGADDGPVLAAMYWHALGAIWLALYATLWLGSLR